MAYFVLGGARNIRRAPFFLTSFAMSEHLSEYEFWFPVSFFGEQLVRRCVLQEVQRCNLSAPSYFFLRVANQYPTTNAKIVLNILSSPLSKYYIFVVQASSFCALRIAYSWQAASKYVSKKCANSRLVVPVNSCPK